MKYKVGDKVRVKSLEWYNRNKNENGRIDCDESVFFEANMSKLCGSIVTIKNIDVDIDAYEVKENSYYWTDEMFEGLAKDTIQPIVFENIVADKVELCLGDDYEIVVEDGRTFVQKKKPKYPKSFQECYYLLYGQQDLTFGCDIMKGAYGNLLECLQMLLICREVYWRIAGNELRLNEPWRYDMSKGEFSSAIIYHNGFVQANEVRHKNHILVFPTAEMRDAFYENFKDLIESCKELL
jgi:hypothetical protein